MDQEFVREDRLTTGHYNYININIYEMTLPLHAGGTLYERGAQRLPCMLIIFAS